METTRFNIADYLADRETIVEYLNTVLEDGSSADLIEAIGHIAKALGMSKIAQETGMSRPSLYKAFSQGAKPQFDTVLKVLKAIGGELKISPVDKEAS